jgi:16S rRNA (guanine966-N2)-methyltransferase
VRIIAGEHRGRKLLPPESDATRPVTDRVKQSLFDVLGKRVEGAVVADIFSGTGSFGLECLSRGASRCVFVESGKQALGRLRRNIVAIDVEQRANVVTRDAYRLEFAEPFDLIFLDPPYAHLRERTSDVIQLVATARTSLADQGLAILRHGAGEDDLHLGDGEASRRRWGQMTARFYSRA